MVQSMASAPFDARLFHPNPFSYYRVLFLSSKIWAQLLHQALLGKCINLIRPLSRRDPDHPALFLIVLHDRHAGFLKRLEPLLDRLLIVIRAAARLAPLEQALLHDLLGAVEEQHELGRAHGLLEPQRLVHLAREAIDEELALAGLVLLQRLGHGVLQELHRHLHGHDGPVLDAVLDQLAKLRAGPFLLGAQ